jgi:hypothetical protein
MLYEMCEQKIVLNKHFLKEYTGSTLKKLTMLDVAC